MYVFLVRDIDPFLQGSFENYQWRVAEFIANVVGHEAGADVAMLVFHGEGGVSRSPEFNQFDRQGILKTNLPWLWGGVVTKGGAAVPGQTFEIDHRAELMQ